MVHEEQIKKNTGDRKLHDICKASPQETLSSTEVENRKRYLCDCARKNIWKNPRDGRTENKSISVT